MGGGLTAAMLRAYRRFLRWDEEANVRVARDHYGKDEEAARLSWRNNSMASPREFEIMAWRLARVGGVRELARDYPMLSDKALRLAGSLREEGLIELSEDGRVTPLDRWFSGPSPIRFERPTIEVDLNLDQLQCTEETLNRRIRLIGELFPLRGREVAVMGDDDFVAAPLAASTGAEVTVFELDERVIGLTGEVADALGVEVRVARTDLREPLPREYRDRFDLFIADPPYTAPGVETFLLRGWESLRKERGSAGVISYLPDEMGRREAEVLGFAADLGFTLWRMHPGFNEYEVPPSGPISEPTVAEGVRLGSEALGRKSIGYYSNLYVLMMVSAGTSAPPEVEGDPYDYFPP